MRRWLGWLFTWSVACAGCAGAPPPYSYLPVIHAVDAEHPARPTDDAARSAVEPRVLAGLVSRHRRVLGRCRTVADTPMRIDVELEIAKEGSVTDARVSGPSIDVTSCVKHTVESWRFPKSNVASLARFPLVFQPEAE